jgi:triosephosphate isomerase
MNKLLIANFKMNFNAKQIDAWCHSFTENLKLSEGIVLCPPIVHIHQVKEFFRARGAKISIGAQQALSLAEGALTGEVSISMLSGLVQYLIIGHSEQRAFLKPSTEELAAEVEQALSYGITPVLCVGDSLEQKNSGRDDQIIEDQIISAIANLAPEQAKKIIIAYEPIWAIGSGQTPTNQQIDAKLKLISKLLTAKISESGYVFVNILYGGSVNASNIQHLNAVTGLQGYLVGGASLDAEQFARMASLLENAE